MTRTVSPRFLQIADLVLDRERNCLLREGEVVRMEPRVACLLTYLAEADGRPVSRDELIREVWGTHVVDDAVHRAVSLLRTALGDDSKASRLIETVPGKGYRLLAKAMPVGRPERRSSPRRALAAAAVVGVIVGAGLATLVSGLDRQPPAYAPPAPAFSGSPTATVAPKAP